MAATSYPELLSQAQPQIIDSDSAHRRALRSVEFLMEKAQLTAAERKLLDLQAKLIADYEETIYPTPSVSPSAMLEHLIQSKNTTQAELARLAGVSRSTVSEVLKGKRGLSIENAHRIAEFFGVQPALFLKRR